MSNYANKPANCVKKPKALGLEAEALKDIREALENGEELDAQQQIVADNLRKQYPGASNDFIIYLPIHEEERLFQEQVAKNEQANHVEEEIDQYRNILNQSKLKAAALKSYTASSTTDIQKNRNC